MEYNCRVAICVVLLSAVVAALFFCTLPIFFFLDEFLDEKEAKNQGCLEIPGFLRLAALDEGNSHCVLRHPSSFRYARLEKLRNF